MKTTSIFACITALVIILCFTASNGQLSEAFYAETCPLVLTKVKTAVAAAVAKEIRMAASLLRLHFSDCFVNGCDGSILLDDTSTFTGEKTAFENFNSLRGFDVIDTIKTEVEAVCSGVVSCADILAIAARDSSVLTGGPTWPVQLGRRDSTDASLSDANTYLPSPSSDLATLISAFEVQGLSAKDMIALSGAHTLGRARCTNFRSRVFNDTNIDTPFATLLRLNCPSNGGDDNLAPLDQVTPVVFDNNYYLNLINNKGLLHSDQALYSGGSSDATVTTYVGNPTAFFNDFATAMVNMGNICPLTGTCGEVRTNCRITN